MQWKNYRLTLLAALAVLSMAIMPMTDAKAIHITFEEGESIVIKGKTTKNVTNKKNVNAKGQVPNML